MDPEDKHVEAEQETARILLPQRNPPGYSEGRKVLRERSEIFDKTARLFYPTAGNWSEKRTGLASLMQITAGEVDALKLGRAWLSETAISELVIAAGEKRDSTDASLLEGLIAEVEAHAHTLGDLSVDQKREIDKSHASSKNCSEATHVDEATFSAAQFPQVCSGLHFTSPNGENHIEPFIPGTKLTLRYFDGRPAEVIRILNWAPEPPANIDEANVSKHDETSSES